MIYTQQLEVIVMNTVAVLTTMADKKAEWREVLDGAWQRAGSLGAVHEHAFLGVLLATLDGKPAPALAKDNPYYAALAQIEEAIKTGGVHAPPLAPEVMQALNALLTSETWPAARQVLEAQGAVLLQPEVEDVLDQLAEGAVNDGKAELAENFAMHRDLLRLCREQGIETAFSEFGLQDDPHAELAEQAVAGLGGSPAQRMALAQRIAHLLKSEQDPAERSLLETIQMAIFSKNPAAVQHKLQGEQEKVWGEILSRIESSE